MSDIAKRLEGLTPEQRRLLEKRVKEKGLPTPWSGGAVGEARCEQPLGLPLTAPAAAVPTRPVKFSLFFFSADGDATGENKYGFLLEAAQYADRNGFEAVWLPERHFHPFGGLYPNAAVLTAAIASVTKRIRLRSGSVILSLHSPLQVVEDWSVVDNLSGGRVDLGVGAGWNPNDFVLSPDTWERRAEIVYRRIEELQALWSGEKVAYPGIAGEPVAVATLPRPLQSKLNLWLTSGASERTYRRAGELGLNLLTAIIGQDLESLAGRLGMYRQARASHGHAPGEGQVTMLIHTYLGESDAAVRDTVRGPFLAYLKTFVTAAQLTGPAQPGELSFESLSDDDQNAILEHAFQRYYENAGLFGTRATCLPVVTRLADAGVDEIACLVDFGVDTAAVMRSLELLTRLKDDYRAAVEAAAAAARIP